MEPLAARLELVEHLVERAQALTVTVTGVAMAGLVVVAGWLISSDIADHATVTGLDPAAAALAITVAALAVKGLFAGLAALIRPRPAVPEGPRPRPYCEPR